MPVAAGQLTLKSTLKGQMFRMVIITEPFLREMAYSPRLSFYETASLETRLEICAGGPAVPVKFVTGSWWDVCSEVLT